jgi:hypothetical protein
MDYGNVNKLMSVFGCSRQMVSMSLNFKKNSALARKIRSVAKSQYGGKEVRIVPADE